MTLGTPENATEEDLESGKLSKKKMKKSRSCSEGFQPYMITPLLIIH